MLGRRHKSLIGLDIGASALKTVVLHGTGEGCRLVAAPAEPLPPECVVDGAIADPAGVSDGIGPLKIQAKVVAVSLSGHAVIVKKIALPAMPEVELGDAIEWEARQHIPFDSSDVNLDYLVMEPRPSAGSRDLDVVLIATVSGCVQESAAPDPFSGPSELGLSLSLTASPDVLPLDGGAGIHRDLCTRTQRRRASQSQSDPPDGN